MMTLEEIASRFQQARKVNETQWVCLCPLHDDHEPSLYWTQTAKGIFPKCRGCGADGRRIDDFLAAGGLSRADLGLREKGAGNSEGAGRGLTLADYAAARFLPKEYLASVWGLSDGDFNGTPAVLMPYYDGSGAAVDLRIRRGMAKEGQRFAWDKRRFDKRSHTLYGLGVVKMPLDSVVLVEGESDTQTLNYAGFAALGLSGATYHTPKGIERDLSQCKAVFIHLEKDSGGRAVYDLFRGSAILGKARFFSLSEYKDPSEAFCRLKGNIEDFRKVMENALGGAVPYAEFDASILPDAREKKADGRAQTSAENGRRGGRPEADVLGFARAFAEGREAQGQRLVWDSKKGDWLEFDGKCYRTLSDGEMETMLMRELQGHIEAGNERHLTATEGARNSVLANLKPLCEARMPGDRLDGNFPLRRGEGGLVCGEYEGDVIAARNCLLLVHADGVARFDLSQDFFNVENLGCDYVPNADCPTFRRFIEEVVPDGQTRGALQNLLGYALGHGREMHKVLFLVGAGRNGKTTLLDIFAAVLGENNVANIAWHSMTERFATIEFARKRVNISEETEFNRDDLQIFTGFVKNISGEGRLHCDRKNRESIEAKAVSQLVFSANAMPCLPDPSNALRDRLVIVPFRVRIEAEKRDPGLKDKIKAGELPGVLNWLLQGLVNVRRAMARGGCLAGLFASQEIEEASGKAWREANPFYEMIRGAFRSMPGNFVFHAGAMAYINARCAEDGMARRNAVSFAQAMEAMHKAEKKRIRSYGRNPGYADMACMVNSIDGKAINAIVLTPEKIGEMFGGGD